MHQQIIPHIAENGGDVDIFFSWYTLIIVLIVLISLYIRRANVISGNRQITPDIRDFMEYSLYREVANTYRNDATNKTYENLFRVALEEFCENIHSGNVKRAQKIKQLWFQPEPEQVTRLVDLRYFIEYHICEFRFEYCRTKYHESLESLSIHPISEILREQTIRAGKDFVTAAADLGLSHINSSSVEAEIKEAVGKKG